MVPPVAAPWGVGEPSKASKASKAKKVDIWKDIPDYDLDVNPHKIAGQNTQNLKSMLKKLYPYIFIE